MSVIALMSIAKENSQDDGVKACYKAKKIDVGKSKLLAARIESLCSRDCAST